MIKHSLFLVIVTAVGIASVATADVQPVTLSATGPAVTFTPDSDQAAPSAGPVTIAYRIIGKPVVGQPVAIELRLESRFGSQPLKLEYRISDETAMRLAESQPASLTISPGADGSAGMQRVTVVPQREGRLYLNVAAGIETDDGYVGTVTALPVVVAETPAGATAPGDPET